MIAQNYLETVEKLYIGYYQRPADPEGLIYWAQRLANGESVADIAPAFAHSQEALKLYGTIDEESIDNVITAIYQAAFNRDPDPEGFIYYKQGFIEGRFDAATILWDVLSGARNEDALILQNKTQTALNFTKLYDPDLDGIAQKKIYAIDFDAAKMVLQEVSTAAISEEELQQRIEETLLDLYAERYSRQADTETKKMEEKDFQALFSGDYWHKSTIVYSFLTPQEAASQGLGAFSEEEKEITRDIFRALEDIIPLTFVEGEDGDITFANGYLPYQTLGNTLTTTYPENSQIIQAQITIDSSKNYFDTDTAYRLYETIAHEIGHALGLKHPFEGLYQLPTSKDDTFHTLMSYTQTHSYLLDFGYNSVEFARWVFPQPYALYDIGALQKIYGKAKTASGDDIYSLRFDQGLALSIVDSGGIDTIDLRENEGGDIIDLRSGSLNSADLHEGKLLFEFYKQYAPRNDSAYLEWMQDVLNENEPDLFTGKDDLAIAYGSVIENLLTGSGEDIVYDNFVDNEIATFDGDDTIHLGAGGFDRIDGGKGEDRVEAPFIDIRPLLDGYLIVGEEFGAYLQNIETLFNPITEEELFLA